MRSLSSTTLLVVLLAPNALLAWTPTPGLRAAIRRPACGSPPQSSPLTPLQRVEAAPVMRINGSGGGNFDPRSLVGPVIFASLIASGALGWLFNGLLFLSVLPLVVGPLFSWYLENNLMEGNCPECGAPVQVLKGQRGQCMYCGSSMSSDRTPSGVFTREGVKASPSEDGVVEVEVLTDDDY